VSQTGGMQRATIPLALVFGILAVSTASTFVRFAQAGAPSLVIAAGRLGIATLVLAPFALTRHRDALRALPPRDWALGLLAGLFLALHFATWITSLEHTSVVSSVVIVTTSPLWVALLSPLVLRERLSRATVVGIALALAGGVIVGLAGPAGAGGHGAHPKALLGDFLALVGAWMMAGYLLVGRRLRERLPLVPYVFVVYGMAAVVLVGSCVFTGQSAAGLSGSTWLWIVLLALIPQLLGHSTFNWALAHLPAAVVSVGLLGEPVGSAIVAYIFLAEAPRPLEVGGAVLILAGIVVAARGARAAAERAAAAT
jgi:drug/metabolite transporter (DMT)-like permease